MLAHEKIRFNIRIAINRSQTSRRVRHALLHIGVIFLKFEFQSRAPGESACRVERPMSVDEHSAREAHSASAQALLYVRNLLAPLERHELCPEFSAVGHRLVPVAAGGRVVYTVVPRGRGRGLGVGLELRAAQHLIGSDYYCKFQEEREAEADGEGALRAA